jgi:hypothetical protein
MYAAQRKREAIYNNKIIKKTKAKYVPTGY